MISVWGWSILVNGILYLRLFSHLDITSSKYRNVEFTSFLAQTCASHLGSCITCCYMAPCVFGHFDACLGGFIRGFGHPRRHTCLRENAFLDLRPEIRYVLRKNMIEFITFYCCYTHFFPFARKSWFWQSTSPTKIMIYGQTKRNEYGSNKT